MNGSSFPVRFFVYSVIYVHVYTRMSEYHLGVISGLCSVIMASVVLLSHCRLNEFPYTIYWKILISILSMSGCVIRYSKRKKKKKKC